MSYGLTTAMNGTIVGVKAITKSDATVLTDYNEGVIVSGAGDVAFVFKDGTTAAFTFAAGGTLKCNFTKILATGTTATGIYGVALGE